MENFIINSKTINTMEFNENAKNLTNGQVVNNDFKILATSELATAIMTVAKLKAKSTARKFGNGKAIDLEGFLITEIWAELSKKDAAFHTVAMVRRLVSLRTVDYIREQSRFNGQVVFSMIEPQAVSADEVDAYEDTIQEASDMELGTALKAFKSSLSDKQRQILDLTTAGYGNNEIVEIVGCSINTPKNTMKKIKELAIQFGL